MLDFFSADVFTEEQGEAQMAYNLTVEGQFAANEMKRQILFEKKTKLSERKKKSPRENSF